MTDAVLTRGQRQTQKARETYAARFKSPQEKAEHYQRLGQLSAERRFVLSGEEKEVLANLLQRLITEEGVGDAAAG